MKRKFAVAAATAALITASLSFTAFAAKADLTKATPEAAMEADDVKDKVQESFDPAGDALVIKDTSANEFAGDGFVKYNGKLYFVKASTGEYELVEECKEYTVSNDEVSPTDVKVVVKNNAQVKQQFVTYDGKEYYVNSNGAYERASAASKPDKKSCEVKTGANTVTTYTRLIAEDGHIVKGWEKFNNSDDAWYYAKEDGTFVEKTWVTTTLNRWFFVAGDGLMLTAGNASGLAVGTLNTDDYVIVDNSGTTGVALVQQKKGATYVVGEDGLWLSGWKWDGTDWLYYTIDGNETGWIKYGDKWALIDDYKAVTNQKAKFNGTAVVLDDAPGYAAATTGYKEYAFDASSYLIIGSGKCGNTVVQSDKNGVVLGGLQKIGGTLYVVGTSNAARITSIYDIDNDTTDDDILVDKTGKVLFNQWLKYEKTPGVEVWSYAGKDGKVVKSTAVKYGNTFCYIDANGEMVTGGAYVLGIAGDVYTLTEMKAANSNIVLKNDSTTLVALKLINSVIINENGIRVNDGWTVIGRDNDGNAVWGYAKDGKAYHGWVLFNNKDWYYIDNGRMLTSTFTPDGYWVGADGVYTSKIR